ncbi:hypothetical protein B0T10DRAFT_487366 [Thelonectria olida]|uniref:Uncharacterized protein n=1 Tax=Thelonectria olida TaxID=1576542 RepID=A0A9P9ANZ9_9HYPO|nr:hypothetical protein B0T10DRAFT_487366 [Thelonectria olida]
MGYSLPQRTDQHQGTKLSMSANQSKRVRFAAWIDNRARAKTKQQETCLKTKASRGAWRRSARLRSREFGLNISGPVDFVSNPSARVSFADLPCPGPVTSQPVGLSFAERMKVNKSKLSASSIEALGSHPIHLTTRSSSKSRMGSYFYTNEGLSSDTLSDTANIASGTDSLPFATPQPAENIDVGPPAAEDFDLKNNILYPFYVEAVAERRDLRRNCDNLRGEKSDLLQIVNGARWVAEDWLGERREGPISGAQAVWQLSEMRERCQWYERKVPSIRLAFDGRLAALDAVMKSQQLMEAVRKEAKELKKSQKRAVVEHQKRCEDRKGRVEAWNEAYNGSICEAVGTQECN